MSEAVEGAQEVQIIKASAKELVTEQVLKARERVMAQKAHAKINLIEERARTGLFRYEKALRKILNKRFSFGFDKDKTTPEVLREYDRIACREAFKILGPRIAIYGSVIGVPFFLFGLVPSIFLSMYYFIGYFTLGVFDDSVAGWNIFWNAGVLNSISLLKNRRHFLRDVADLEKRLSEKV